MDERLIKIVELKNGLRLELLDSSRKVAGDRWQVVLTIRIDIPVRMLAGNEKNQSDMNVAEIISFLGEKVCFEQKRERNFIGENQKEDVLNHLIDSFIHSSIEYVSNPDFPQNYILRQYKKFLNRKSWYPDYQNE